MITACVGLGFVVLIQNPKGGGLNANVGGLSNNFMGVKQTNDGLEKSTWIFVAIFFLLAMTSTLFLRSAGSDTEKGLINKVNTSSTNPQVAPPPPPANPTKPVGNK